MQMGPPGEHDELIVTVPENWFKLTTLTKSFVSESPFASWIVRVLGVMSKYPPRIFVNLAIWEFSASTAVAPLEIVTQTPPETLVFVHPVWKLIGEFAVFPTTR